VACCFVSFSFLIAASTSFRDGPVVPFIGVSARLPLVLVLLARSWHGVQLLQGQHAPACEGVAMAL
jgi:hypothetical protein